MTDSQITNKIYGNIGLGKQVSSASHHSVLTSKVEFAPSTKSGGGSLLVNGGSFLQNKYTQLGTGNYGNHFNNNNTLKDAPMNGQLKNLHSDRQKYVRVHQQQNMKEDSNCNLVSETWSPEPRKRISDPRMVRLDWVQPGLRIGAGLANLGNTCFMNTVIQCLTYCPPLASYLLQDPERHCVTCKITSFCMMCELQKHIKRALDKHGQAIRPTYMYQKLKSIAKHFQPGRQEDAHEFLRYVIDNLWKSALSTHEGHAKLDPASKETTAINHIFGGYSRSQVVCLRCHGCSNTYDHFMDIILDIKGVTSLEGALEKFVEPEMLEDDNAYKCPKCNLKVRAEKKFNVYKAPNVATFQFKRFDYHRFNGGKITKHINYPERLNLRSYMAEKTAESVWYKLNSVLVHAGHTCNSGHYYCYVRAPNNQWYRMDDTMVQPVGLNQVLHQQAYVLFYVRLSSQKSAAKKPALPFNHTPFNSERNGSSGHFVNVNRTISTSPRPPYVNSHSCNSRLDPPPLTNGTLAPPSSKFTGIQTSATSKSTGRERIMFNLNKNNSLVKVKGRPPENNSSMPAVHTAPGMKQQTLLVPYTGDSSTSASDSSSEPERKQAKTLEPKATFPPTAKHECNGNAIKDDIKSEVTGRKSTSACFERPSDGTVNRPKATNSWNVSDANLQSPSIASNSSNNSMNSTTMEWNVTDQEATNQRHSNRNYNGWAITPNTVSKVENSDSLHSKLPEPVPHLPNSNKLLQSEIKENEEQETETEESCLLPFRVTPQGGGGETTKLCLKDTPKRDNSGQRDLQQSSQYTVPFGNTFQEQSSASPNQQQQQTSVSTTADHSSSPDGKRKRLDIPGSHEESHSAVSKRHKDRHHSNSSSGSSNNISSSKHDRTVRSFHRDHSKNHSRNRKCPKEEKRKDNRHYHYHQHHHQFTTMSHTPSSSSEEWEERTKDTIEKERKQRLKEGGSLQRQWDGSSHQVSYEGSIEQPNSDTLHKLISNGGRSYGTSVNTWDGKKSSFDTGISGMNHKKRFSDQYNEDFDKGKDRKDRRRHPHPNSFNSYGNPFQKTYDRNRNWNFKGQNRIGYRFSDYHKRHHDGHGDSFRDSSYYNQNKKYQQGSYQNRYHNFSGRESYFHSR